MLNNIQNEVSFCISVNLVTLAFMAGVYVHTLKTLEKNQKEIKENHDKAIENLRNYLLEKIGDVKDYFIEHLGRLELKQDKHNNLIERMAIVEQSAKSAHHRQDEANKRIEELEREYHELEF